jgi:signal transduction histidine kinase
VGVIAASTRSDEPFPANTESQIASFTELVATAVENAEARAELRDSTLRLRVSDDGAGGAETQGGSGLLGLRDRVEALGGSIEVTSPVGHGTVIQVSLPIERTDAEGPPASP